MKILFQKTALLIYINLFFLGVNIGFSQIQAPDSVITYSKVELVDSISQSQLFINARDWFNKTFNSSKDVLQITDKENGQLSGKAILGGTYKIKSYTCDIDCNFSIEIKVRDGKYKYSFTDFIPNYGKQRACEIQFPKLTSSESCPEKLPFFNQEKSNLYWQIYKVAVDERMISIIEQLKMAMQKKADNGF